MAAQRPGDTGEIVLPAGGTARTALVEGLRRQQSAAPRSALARFFGLSPLGSAGRGWYRAALHELRVSDALDALPAPWHVLHTHGLGEAGTGIDHVLVGPGGVFAVTTTNQASHRVTFRGEEFHVDGFPTPLARLARQEAFRASRLLGDLAGQDVSVTPLLVVAGATSLRYDAGLAAPSGGEVDVVAARRLTSWLRGLPAQVTSPHVEVSVRALGERGVWGDGSASPDGPGLAPGDEALQGFRTVRAQVDRARRRARGWVIAVATVLLGTVVLETAFFVTEAVQSRG